MITVTMPSGNNNIAIGSNASATGQAQTAVGYNSTARGYRSIAIACAFGGRLDHTFANFQTAAFLVSRGADVRLLGRDTEALVFTGKTVSVPRKAGWSLSLFSLTDTCEGVEIRGTEYEGRDITLTNTFPLGVSNVWKADAASVTAEKGILLVLQSRLKDGEHI